MEHTHRAGRARRRALLVGATAAIVAGVASVAVAVHVDNMYPTKRYNPTCVDGSMGSTYCQTDSTTLTYYRQVSLSDTGKTRIWSVLDAEYSPTQLSISHQDPPVYSGEAETDVIYLYRSDVPSGAAGITWCNDAISSTRCDQHYAAFKVASPARTTICHETGHAVGLTHPSSADPPLANDDPNMGCITTPAITDDLGAHNTNMINATY